VTISAKITLIHESFFADLINGGIANTWVFKPIAVMASKITLKIDTEFELLIRISPP
jgi:hypothetical protein